MRRRASATSLCTTLMLSELKMRPRSVSSREHALRMITASGSSSSSRESFPSVETSARGVGGATAVTDDVPGASTRDGPLAEKSWSCVSRLIARRPELESKSVIVFIWSASGLAKKRFAAVLMSWSVSPTETIALARTRTLIGCGVPFSSRSAVWSVMSRSTLRRNDATIIGSTTSTPMTIAAMRMSVFMDGRMKEVVRSPVGNADDTAMARGVDAGNADEITGANACAARAVVRGECGEQLHDLTVDVERDESLAVRVEAHHGAGVVLDRALERRSGRGLEAEQ